MKEIPIEEIEFNVYSIADDVGRLFSWQGRLFRAIRSYQAEYVKTLFVSGLLEKLVKERLFPESQITEYFIEGFPLVVEHMRITPVIYSYEWSFSMLKDAALTVLKINSIAQKYRYQLKDCHGYNILFDRLMPVFIDLGSFVPIKKGENWIAYEEFMRFYYYPLKMWSSGDSYVGRMSLFAEHGMMPHSSYYSYRFYIPLIKHIRRRLDKIFGLYFRYLRLNRSSLEKYKTKFPKYLYKITAFLCKKGILPHKKVRMDLLLKKVERIKKPKCSSLWADYQDVYFAPNGEIKNISPRFARIIDIVNSCSDIKSVIDIGGNKGAFSLCLLKETNVNKVLCLDYDEYAMDEMYIRFRNSTHRVDAIILQDVVRPVVTRNVQPPSERFISDAVVALALSHHLILSQRIAVEHVFEVIGSYSKKYVFIEFMPLGLYSSSKSPVPPAWYNINWFRKYFVMYFTLILEEELEKNRVLFFGTKK